VEKPRRAKDIHELHEFSRKRFTANDANLANYANVPLYGKIVTQNEMGGVRLWIFKHEETKGTKK